MNLFKKLLSPKLLGIGRDNSGATAIEYALIAGIICLAVIGGATAVGSAANDAYLAANSGFN